MKINFIVSYKKLIEIACFGKIRVYINFGDFGD